MYSKRRSNRLNLSSHANVRSTRSRNAWIAALNSRLRPRLVALRLRGFSLMFGIIPALKIALRFALASNPPSRAAPGKFESKRFCFNKKVSIRWYVTFIHIFVVLYLKDLFHADSQTALSR